REDRDAGGRAGERRRHPPLQLDGRPLLPPRRRRRELLLRHAPQRVRPGGSGQRRHGHRLRGRQRQRGRHPSPPLRDPPRRPGQRHQPVPHGEGGLRLILGDPPPPYAAGMADTVIEHVERTWDDEIVPALVEYIAIPAKSPAFDPDWAANGHLDAAVALVRDWCAGRAIAGLHVEVVRLEGRTPVVLVEVPASPSGGEAAPAGTVLLYGHLDKQPEMTGWREGLGP